MARSRRAQVLMEPADYAELERLARREHVSLSELILRAVKDRYLDRPNAEEADALLEELFSMNLTLGDWKDLQKEIESAHDAGVR